MKTRIGFTAALLVICGLLSVIAPAQSQRGIQLKQDYENRKSRRDASPDIEVRERQLRARRPRPRLQTG